MKVRSVVAVILAAMLLAAGILFVAHERRDALYPAAIRLEFASRAIFNDLEANTERSQLGAHGAEDQVAAMMDADRLLSKARRVSELLRQGASEHTLQAAVQDVADLLKPVTGRLQHAGATLEARRHLEEAQSATDELLDRLGEPRVATRKAPN